MLLDRHVQNVPSQQQMMAGVRPTWEENTTGLEDLLKKWGAEITTNLVLDEESYISRQQNQQQQLFQVPILSGESFNRDIVVTSGLEDLILLNAGKIISTVKKEKEGSVSETDPRYTTLLRSSPKAWTVTDPMKITSYLQGAPETADTERQDLAVLLEGKFRSTFDEPVSLPPPRVEGSPVNGNGASETISPADNGSGTHNSSDFSGDRFRQTSVEPSKIILVGTSALTTTQLLDPRSRTSNGIFLLNALDFINGTPGFAELRSKGLGVPRLVIPSPTYRSFAKWMNTILVPLLVLFIGLLVWFRRRNRSRRIRDMFQENPEVKL